MSIIDVEDCYNKIKNVEDFSDEIINYLEKKGVYIKLKLYKIYQTRYVFKVKMCKRTRSVKLMNCMEDLKLNLGVKDVFIDKDEENSALYLVVLISRIKPPNLIKVLGHDEFYANSNIAHLIGVDYMGHVVTEDLTEYPHLMISGTTKSGKSVAMECLLLTLLKYNPDYVNLIICDQTANYLKFAGLPHLSCPIVQDNETFIKVLILLKSEMERRIKLEGTDEYDELPYIICAVDEFPAFVSMNDARKNQLAVEILQSILRRGRHARIHLVLAANDPKKDNVKIDVSDIPAKMTFRVANFHNSIAAIGTGGAEKLKERGEMYFLNGDLKHLQGMYVSPKEVLLELMYLKTRFRNNSFDVRRCFYITDEDLMSTDIEIGNAETNFVRTVQDDLLPSVIVWALSQNEVSCNAVKNRFNVGWNRASRIMDKLNEFDIVCAPFSTLPRKVMPQSFSDISPAAKKLLENSGYDKRAEEAIRNRTADTAT